MICHLSLGINISILVILLIFGLLFSLPLKLLLNTNYGEGAVSEGETSPGPNPGIKEISLDYRSLKLCRNFDYESAVKSVFFSSYDKNCTHVREGVKSSKAENVQPRKSKLRIIAEKAGIIDSKFDEESDKSIDTSRKKSLSIAGHILAVMLIGSAIAALVEVLRARFCAVKEHRPDGSTTGRRSSLVDLAQRRHVKKDTIQAQKSFEIQGMMHRSPLRLIAARPPPLLRRSSFPAQCFNQKDLPVLTTATTAAHGRLSRRPSFVVDSDEESNSLTDFRRHTRLIRRH